MKTSKQLISLLLVFILLFATSNGSFADENSKYVDCATGKGYDQVSTIIENCSAGIINPEDIYERLEENQYINVIQHYENQKNAIINFLNKYNFFDSEHTPNQENALALINENKDDFILDLHHAKTDFLLHHTKTYKEIVGDNNQPDMEYPKTRKTNYFISSKYSHTYFSLDLIDQDLLAFDYVPDSSEIKNWWIHIRRQENNTNKDEGYMDKMGTVTGEIISDYLDLSTLDEGEYFVELYVNKNDEPYYRGLYLYIPFIKNQNRWYFLNASTLDYNSKVLHTITNIDPESYLHSELKTIEDRLFMKELVNSIVDEFDTDYEKALKIHDWVANRIYYDYDYYYGKTANTEINPMDVYLSSKSVCQGYAELTRELFRAAGMPCMLVTGYTPLSEGPIEEEWEYHLQYESDHAWNLAYVEGRWILLDVTWDSNNQYENGEYKTEAATHQYFDADLNYFSYDHIFEY